MNDVVIGPVAAPDLHVMTFNVRRRITGTARSRDRWSARRPLLRRLLRREQPGLLGVQEAMPDQAAAIVDALGEEYAFVGRGRERGGRGEGCPVFFDGERLELLAWEQVALSDEPSQAGSRSWGNPLPRLYVEAVFRDRATGTEFVAINTHLDPFSAKSRVRAAAALRRRIAESERPCVLTGDLNARPGSPAVRELLAEDRLQDAWTVARTRLTPEWGTNPGYRPPRIGASRIDWIAVTPGIDVECAAIDARPIDGAWPSDHLPVQAVIALPQRSAGA